MPLNLTKLGALLTAILCASVVASAAVPSSEEAHDLAEKYREARKTVVETEAEKRKILGSLYSINQRMKKIGSEKGRLTDELFQVQDNVKSLAKVIAGLEVQIDKQRRQLKRRLRALYKLSGEGFLGAVFSQASAPELDETLRYLKIITDTDYRMIRSYQENIATYLAQRKKLKRQVEKLVALEKKIKTQEGLLTSEHRAKSHIVSELDRNRSASLNRMKSLRSKSQLLKANPAMAAIDELDELLKPSIFEQKGVLPAPVSGKVTQDFGLITDERYKIRLSHKGWRYAAPKGSSVSAVYDGSVIFIDRVKGYGLTLIVDHGDHYYSVYSHISRVKLKTGDSVRKGQVLAEAGAATRRHQEGIYFEIRHFSEPENPAAWIAAQGSLARLNE